MERLAIRRLPDRTRWEEALRHQRHSTREATQLQERATAARCELCGRDVAAVTAHHLTPRSEGGTETVALCCACHRQVHALFTNRTLAAALDTLAKLRAAPEIRRYLAWIRRQSDRRVPVRRSRSRR